HAPSFRMTRRPFAHRAGRAAISLPHYRVGPVMDFKRNYFQSTPPDDYVRVFSAAQQSLH
ncbi:hypothetical protein, partial [Azospirillum sp. B4]|uniref:hypothetical protein n=1 Tax=Azospirillum sp. B4 TaxID=95605 RepID=UPI001B3BF400